MTNVVFVLIEGFADWERAPVAALLAGFDVEIAHASPGGAPVTSIGRLAATPTLRLEDVAPDRFDAVVVIGSEGWQQAETRAAVVPLVAAAHRAGRVVAGICGATLVLAEAGLFDGRPHTSNGRAFLEAHLRDHSAGDAYVEGSRAVASDRVVTASGLAPVSFAAEVARLLVPERAEEIEGFAAMMGAEHQAEA